MTAVLLVARSVLRRRWRSLLVIAVLAGLAGGAAAGAVTLARRTATAYPRLEAATGFGDAVALVFGGRAVTEEVTELPGIADARVGRLWVGDVLDVPNEFIGITASPPEQPYATPALVEGRWPAPDAPDEVVLPDWMAEYGVGIGTRLEVGLLSAAQFGRFPTPGTPEGPTLDLEVVGVVRRSGLPEIVPPLHAGPAFWERLDEWAAGELVAIDLEHQDQAGDLALAVAELDRRSERAEDRDEFPAVGLTFLGPARDSIESTTEILVVGLVVFAAVTALAGALALVQALSRLHAVDAGDQLTEAALGLPSGSRMLARTLPVLPAAVLGVVGTAAGAVIGGRFEPMGGARRLEPSPGPHVNLAVLGVACAASLVVVLVAGLVTARRAAVRRSVAPARPSAIVERLARVGTGPAGTTGVRFALEPGRGAAAVPTRTAITAALLGVLGVSALLVFSSATNRLQSQPERWGGAFELRLANDKALETVAGLDGVAGVVHETVADAVLEDEQVVTVGLRTVSGEAGWGLLEGRAPERSGEVALGTRQARRIGVGVGDDVSFVDRAGESHHAAVVGIGLGTEGGSEQLGSRVLVWPEDQAIIGLAEPVGATLLDVPDVMVPVVIDQLRDTALFPDGNEISPREVPTEVRNLDALGALPVLLGAFLAGIGLLALGNALVLAARRRRRDVAVMRTLGFVPGQAAATLLVMSLTAALAGLAVGLPLGVAAGSLLWRRVAEQVAVAGDAAIPWPALTLVVAGTVALAALTSALPAYRAARIRPAEVLRTE